MIAGIEAVEGGKNGGVGLRIVGHGQVIDVFVWHEPVAVGIFGDARAEGAGLVFEDRFFHEGDTGTAPPANGEVVDEVTLGEIAGLEVGTGGGDETSEPDDTFGSDGEDSEFPFEVSGAGFWRE